MKGLKWIQKRLLYLAIGLSVLSHLPFLDLSPRSVHLWRQAHTLAVARNFLEEGMNPFLTRVDNRFEGSGITGSHFPGFEFALACVYQITGESYALQRSFCLVLHLLAIAGMYALGRLVFRDEKLAAWAAWAFTWSPLLFYYAITPLPDNLALPASIWGFWATLKWIRMQETTGSTQNYGLPVFGFLCLLLAGLCKIQYLAVGFPVLAYLILHRSRFSAGAWATFCLFGLAISALAIAWYLRAARLIESSGLKDFGITFHPESDWAEIRDILVSNLVSSLPENVLNFAGFVLFGFGLYQLWENRQSPFPLRIPFLIWALVLCVYHLVELGQMKFHDYYMMPYLPLLSLVMAKGAEAFQHRWGKALWILLFLQPVLAGIRIIPSRFLAEEKSPHGIFYRDEARKRLEDAVPDSALCVVGPDNSRCIYFYFLHKKGFGFGDEGLAAPTLENYIRRGARYIYSTRDAVFRHKDWPPYLGKRLAAEGELEVYPLHLPEEKSGP
jgi:hypothetical protein